MNKKELRKNYLAQQKSLSNSERDFFSQKITDSFFNNFSIGEFNNLHLFLSIEKNREVETKFIYEKIWQNFPHIRTFVPRVCGENLEHLEFSKDTKFRVSDWGIVEPVGNNLIEERLFDAVIVPLLCFDRTGYRVGYGKGFYDKFLSICREDCLKIGVSFFEPIEAIADKNKFDVKLNYCLTPNSIYSF